MIWQTGSEVLPAFVDSPATLTAEPNRPVLGEEYLSRAVELTAQGFGTTQSISALVLNLHVLEGKLAPTGAGSRAGIFLP